MTSLIVSSTKHLPIYNCSWTMKICLGLLKRKAMIPFTTKIESKIKEKQPQILILRSTACGRHGRPHKSFRPSRVWLNTKSSPHEQKCQKSYHFFLIFTSSLQRFFQMVSFTTTLLIFVKRFQLGIQETVLLFQVRPLQTLNDIEHSLSVIYKQGR